MNTYINPKFILESIVLYPKGTKHQPINAKTKEMAGATTNTPNFIFLGKTCSLNKSLKASAKGWSNPNSNLFGPFRFCVPAINLRSITVISATDINTDTIVLIISSSPTHSVWSTKFFYNFKRRFLHEIHFHNLLRIFHYWIVTKINSKLCEVIEDLIQFN